MDMTDDTTPAGQHRQTAKRSGNKEGPVDSGEIPTVSPETVFDLLADRHRHAVLAYLENTEDGRAPVSDLAAAVSHYTDAGIPHSDIMSQLYHVHLPKIAKAELIDYDRDENSVQYIGHPLIEDCLDLVGE